eukprot:993860_1
MKISVLCLQLLSIFTVAYCVTTFITNAIRGGMHRDAEDLDEFYEEESGKVNKYIFAVCLCLIILWILLVVYLFMKMFGLARTNDSHHVYAPLNAFRLRDRNESRYSLDEDMIP